MSEQRTVATIMQQTGGVDTSINLDDIVNVYVARHEAKLMQDQRDLQQQLRQTNAAISSWKKGVLNRVKDMVTAKEVLVGMTRISVEIKESNSVLNVQEDGTFNTHLITTVKVGEGAKFAGYCGDKSTTETSYSSMVQFVLTKEERDEHQAFTTNVKELTEKLGEVNTNLRQIEHKTRVLRGRLAERKLEAAGVANLIGDEELMKLLG